MPVIVAWIGTMLLSVVGQMVLSALVSLGIGFATHNILPATFGDAGIRSMMGSAGVMVDYAGWLGVDQFITIIWSAWMGRRFVESTAVAFARIPKK